MRLTWPEDTIYAKTVIGKFHRELVSSSKLGDNLIEAGITDLESQLAVSEKDFLSHRSDSF